MTLHTFHTLKSSIPALNPLGFPNKREAISLTHLCNNTFDLYFLNAFEIQLQYSVQNVFRHEFTNLPRDHESRSSIKSTQIPKYNAKRSI
ncbi:uncharacterized protein G2W53_014504 [Senna tora]|uniref:Uncharacterized protein n=1 Tax=Senna tora TaxID=362788 RepID=A0A835C6J1_9FABA|nr:uncharacterized protein G2W53_014504 [Senna tora]